MLPARLLTEPRRRDDDVERPRADVERASEFKTNASTSL
jgi:hypothetical protein